MWGLVYVQHLIVPADFLVKTSFPNRKSQAEGKAMGRFIQWFDLIWFILLEVKRVSFALWCQRRQQCGWSFKGITFPCNQRTYFDKPETPTTDGSFITRQKYSLQSNWGNLPQRIEKDVLPARSEWHQALSTSRHSSWTQELWGYKEGKDVFLRDFEGPALPPPHSFWRSTRPLRFLYQHICCAKAPGEDSGWELLGSIWSDLGRNWLQEFCPGSKLLCKREVACCPRLEMRDKSNVCLPMIQNALHVIMPCNLPILGLGKKEPHACSTESSGVSSLSAQHTKTSWADMVVLSLANLKLWREWRLSNGAVIQSSSQGCRFPAFLREWQLILLKIMV